MLGLSSFDTFYCHKPIEESYQAPPQLEPIRQISNLNNEPIKFLNEFFISFYEIVRKKVKLRLKLIYLPAEHSRKKTDTVSSKVHLLYSSCLVAFDYRNFLAQRSFSVY